MQIRQLVDLFACAVFSVSPDLMIVCSDEETVATNLEIAHETTSSSSRHIGRVKESAAADY